MTITTRSMIHTRSCPLVDRREELESAIAAVHTDNVQLLTVTGTAGVGKTRFAAELTDLLAPDHPEGTVLIDLTAIDDPALLDLELARRLGMRTHDRAHLSDDIDDWITSHAALIVLDNAEHVLEIGSRVVQWAALNPDVRIIVTSRHRLNVSIETELFLDSLTTARHPERASAGSLSAAARMLLRVAGMDALSDVPVETMVAIERLCRQLEGLPMAIELVAARVPSLDTDDLNRLLQAGEIIPLQPDAEVGAALEHAFDWSYWLLTPYAQQLLRYLTVFVDGFTLELAEYQGAHASMLDLHISVADCLDELSAHHLILPTEQPQPGSPVFRMPVIITMSARRRLVAAGEEKDARRAHAEAMTSFAEPRELSGIRPGREREIAELDANFHNLTAALEWFRDHGDGAGLQRLVAALWWFWYAHGFYGAGISWLEEVQRQGGPRDTTRWGIVLTMFGILLNLRGEIERSCEMLDKAWKVQTRYGTSMEQGVTCIAQGITTFHQGRHDDSDAWLYRALELAGSVSDAEIARSIEGIAWENLGANAHERGQLDESERAYRQAIRILQRSGLKWGVARSTCDLGCLLRDRQDLQGALDAFHTALEPANSISDQRLLAAILAGIATVLTDDNQPLLAAWVWGAVATLLPAAGGHASLLKVNTTAYDRSRMLARRRLGPQGYSSAVARGAAAPLAEVLARVQEIRLRKAQAVNIPASIDATLTNRERDVLDLLAQGTSTEGMASTLGITERTVSSHIGSLLRKFNVNSRLELLSATTNSN